MIDRDAAVPLYHQIYLQLRDEILTGQRPHGSSLPTEQELSDIYAVSRITARRVLGELAQQNFVERKRRLGTRVIFQSPSKPMEANIDQAVDSLLAFGRRTTVTVIEVASELPSVTVAAALKIPPNEQVLRAVRVRSMDGEPLGYIVSYVPAALGDVLTDTALSRTPILKLLEEAGHKAEHAEQTISAMQADPVISQALSIEPRSALLRIGRTSYDRDYKPFLLTFAHYRADKFTIRLDLQPQGGTVTPTLTQDAPGKA
uniref:Transcriptional regulator, GntR family n=1 Tax=Sphingomonas sp. JE1 TaxID=1628059 RepID=A0A0D4ZZT6_9SPHN|nr:MULTISPECIES: GntR family transcriptional regulator [unclassified Sphingomonas]AJW29451.1 Transcriptional regulator, GntR family [Sphingomonas sp. JE1]